MSNAVLVEARHQTSEKLNDGCCCSVAQLCPTLYYARSPYYSLSPRVCQSSCPLHRWCHPAISSSDALLSFCLQSFPASGTFPMSWLFASVIKTLELNLQRQSFQWVFRVDFCQDRLVWSPCWPRDSQESSVPQFGGINSLALCLL